MDDITAAPKRQLSEAQRLAFLKGREKRMVNIEKARLAKEEESLSADQFKLAPGPTKQKKPRTKKTTTVVDPEPPPEPELEPEPEPKPEPKLEPEPKPESEPKHVFNEDKLVDKIVAKLKDSYVAVPTIRKPRKAKPAKIMEEEVTTPPPPPATNNFSWL